MLIPPQALFPVHPRSRFWMLPTFVRDLDAYNLMRQISVAIHGTPDLQLPGQTRCRVMDLRFGLDSLRGPSSHKRDDDGLCCCHTYEA